MEKQNPERPIDTWNKLSKDGQSLAIYLAVCCGLTQGREYLEAMASDPKEGFNLDQGMQELTGSGILQRVSLIQEKREKLASMSKPDDIVLIPITEVPRERLSEALSRQLTEEDRKYLKLKREIEEYERDHDKQPERYKRWDEPRYRLSPDFQNFVTEQFDK